MMELLLDAGVRTWCTIPIFALVVLCAFLRQNALLVLRTDPKADLKDGRHRSVVNRAKLLLTPFGNLLNPKGFLARRLYFAKDNAGVLCNPPVQPGIMQALTQAQDPSAMFGMLKNNVAFLMLNGGLAYLVSFLFSGFLVGRVPFPLTYRFKFMLQRGVELSGLDVTYVSSLSWYFLILFGCNGILTVVNTILGQESEVGEMNSTAAMMGSMAMGMGSAMQSQQGGQPAQAALPGMAGADLKKIYSQVKRDIETTQFSFALRDAEAKLFKKWEEADKC